ncbi:hypothetical protein Rhe02_36520 [Rhizocola hellebori]|uniref:non-specific serine/threonine protein kinase n=1 Tax=Rhizocola hellebori TaxID=1392758 RepID=A0A8J3Q9M0_9ACTN|nr:serine/threonine-protein kinase [Rhizocola hellebori]GIH05585.1 hypothetical protein Rhe02_36520 [Rhizocola hellebori]
MTGLLTDLPPGYSDAKHLGSGGWAEVYRCLEVSSGQQAAVKLFHQRLEDPTVDAEQFRHECRTAALLSGHPGVVKVRAAGVTASARPWLAMDLATGGTLARGIRAAGGRLPLAVALDLTTRLADTLSWAHTLASPVIHGDIKAANVLLDEKGRPLLSDFGVATHLGSRHSVTVAQFTQTHAAPEVLGDGRASVSSDVWALTITLFEMLTGAPPFVVRAGEGPGAFIKRVEQGLPADAVPDSIPAPVAEVIRAGLLVDRQQRTAGMAELAESLRSAQRALRLPVTPAWPAVPPEPVRELPFVGYAEALAVAGVRDQPTAEMPTVAVTPAVPKPARGRKPALVAGVIAALVLAGAAFAATRGGEPSAADPQPSITSPAQSPPESPQTSPTPSVSSTASQLPSPAGKPVAKPGVVTTFAVLDHNGGTGLDRRLSFSLTAPPSPLAIVRYEFDYTGDGTPDATSTATTGFLTDLVNGTAYAVRLRACASQVCGDWSAASPPQQPFGPVPKPAAGAAKSGATQINLTWSSAGSNGRPLARLEIRVDGGGWESVGTSNGNRLVGNGYNQTHSIEVRAVDTMNQVSSSASASATTNPAPQVTVTTGTIAPSRTGCSGSACRYIVVTVNNFAPNTGYSCTFNSSSGSGGFSTYNFTTNSSGHFSGQTLNSFGVSSGWVSATCNGVTGTRNPWL